MSPSSVYRVGTPATCAVAAIQDRKMFLLILYIYEYIYTIPILAIYFYII